MDVLEDIKDKADSKLDVPRRSAHQLRDHLLSCWLGWMLGMCNGHDNCGDNSDEAHCTGSIQVTVAATTGRTITVESLQMHTGAFHDREYNFDYFGRFIGKTFIKYSNDDKHSAAAKVLKTAALKNKSPRLAAIAIKVQLDAFVRVKKAIDDMITQRLAEKKDEIKHKDFCVEEFNTNQLQTERKERELITTTMNSTHMLEVQAKFGWITLIALVMRRGSDNAITTVDHEDVGVECCSAAPPVGPPADSNEPGTEGSLRLAGGNAPNQSRLEIFHDEEWGTICDDAFDLTDAGAACRQLGFANGATLSYTAGGGSGTIHLDNLGCISDTDRPGLTSQPNG